MKRTTIVTLNKILDSYTEQLNGADIDLESRQIINSRVLELEEQIKKLEKEVEAES